MYAPDNVYIMLNITFSYSIYFLKKKKQYLSIFIFFLFLTLLSPPPLENFSSFTKCDSKKIITYTKGSFKLLYSHK